MVNNVSSGGTKFVAFLNGIWYHSQFSRFSKLLYIINVCHNIGLTIKIIWSPHVLYFQRPLCPAIGKMVVGGNGPEIEKQILAYPFQNLKSTQCFSWWIKSQHNTKCWVDVIYRNQVVIHKYSFWVS